MNLGHEKSDSTDCQTKKPTRVQRGKSRQGCRLCKARKIKCDETFPNCHNCVRRNLVCPGYTKQLRWSDKHESNKSNHNRAQATESSNTPGVTDLFEVEKDELLASNVTTNPSTNVALLVMPGASGASCDLGINLDIVPAGFSVADRDNLRDFREMQGNQDPRSRADHASFSNSGCATQDMGTLASDSHNQSWPSWADFDSSSLSFEGEESPEEFHLRGAVDLAECALNPNHLGLTARIDLQDSCSFSLSPMHQPTTLIEYWFTNVCPIWSAFDSELNYNRQIASSSWSSSGAVYYTLQRMSMAHILSRSPQCQHQLTLLDIEAKASIRKDMDRLRDTQSSNVEASLVFAVLGFGTSLHWTESTSDTSWLTDMRVLLRRWNSNLSPSQTLIHGYFSQALTYWQMLAFTIMDEPSHQDLGRRRTRHRTEVVKAMLGERADIMPALPKQPELVQNREGTRPNSWCGVSCEVIDIFGQVLTLCRRARRRTRVANFSLSNMCDAISDIKVAQDLEKELHAMDFQTALLFDEFLGFSVDTGDSTSSTSHLIQTAEAYRKAALLQLYLTFEDLDVTDSVGSNSEGTHDLFEYMDQSHYQDVSRPQKLRTLALQVIATLEKLPGNSRSRSMHPILYLAAASGLWFEADQPSRVDSANGVGSRVARGLNRDPSAVDFALSGAGSSIGSSKATTPLQSRTTICGSDQSLALKNPSRLFSIITQARGIVQARLNELQGCLPLRPIKLVSELIWAIWKAYDGTDVGHTKLHWLDVLIDSEYETIFR